ncbi:MAG: hypothetical protein DRG71_01085 [Deltaproteobacteria bacterium]|nr:MAG: hypothetical protein DRG71_01085 [Deltaproteobacteria bacterium]
MEKEKKSQNILWRTLSSVKLTIVLLVLIAIASVIGTFIPQREEAVDFAHRLSPQTFHFFQMLGLFDMYHTAWFRILIGALALNLIICSMDRFPGAWRRFTARPRPDRSKIFQGIPEHQTFVVSQPGESVSSTLEGLLQSKYKGVVKKLSGSTVYFYADKGRFSHFGVYLVHLSVLVIIAGALIGSFFGFEAYVNILEGDQVSSAMLRGKMVPVDLGFTVRCDDFKVSFYDNGAPKEYRSDLSFLHNGEKVKSAVLLVNHPVKFRGITFYQSSYGAVPGDKALIRIVRRASKPQTSSLTVKLGEKVPLPLDDGFFTVSQIKDNFMNMGPAILIKVASQKGKPIRFWVFQYQDRIRRSFPGIFEKFPKLNPSAYKPYTFYLEEIESKYYTGLQLSKDPGVPVVWAGFILIIGGLFITFFASHRRFWIRIESRGGKSKISVAAMASKNPVGLERETHELLQTLKTPFGDKKND